MRTIIITLLAAILLGSPLAAQYHPTGPEITADMDSLLESGMDEILSYLLLTRNDFRFRDDYLEKDSFRLPVIDTLMAHPLKMNDFTDTCAAVFATFNEDSDGTLRFLAGTVNTDYEVAGDYEIIMSRANNSPYQHPVMDPLQIDVSKLGSTWDESRLSLMSILDIWKTDSKRHIRNVLKSKEIEHTVTKYKELILEEVTDKDKSAEEQDSISSIEEQYAIDFAKTARGLRIPEIPGLWFILGELKNIKAEIDTNTILRDKAIQKPVYSGENRYGVKAAIGSLGDDIYRGDYDLIIDPGGNDTYYLSYDPHKPHPTIIADFSGDDIYKAETEFALACGAYAYSLLIDYEGDDIYRAGSFSLGAGYFGVGILWDKKGDDSYFGDTFTQGAGTFGLGLLIDSDGSDTYTGNLFCQGFGFVNGVGGIIDGSGNDTYTVQPRYGDFIRYDDHYISLSQGFGYGIRPWLSGGWGFLFDYGGNDVYVCDIFGQGASYWWSLGMLYDRSGNDQYLSHQYTQGNGTHMSLGILRDDNGNDIYLAYGVSQGCGHDYACGWLQDRRGNDLYATHDLGHGAGQANGMGLCTDLIGDDRYYVRGKHNSQGYGNPRRDYGSIGIFLDLNGDDRYDGNGSNNRFWTLPGSKWGGGLDRQIPVPEVADTTEADNE
jgi:hypothetical protein